MPRLPPGLRRETAAAVAAPPPSSPLVQRRVLGGLAVIGLCASVFLYGLYRYMFGFEVARYAAPQPPFSPPPPQQQQPGTLASLAASPRPAPLMPLVVVTAYQNLAAVGPRSARDKLDYAARWNYTTAVWAVGDRERWWASDEVNRVEPGMDEEPRHIRLESRPPAWLKIPALLRAFRSQDNGSAWFWWIDAEALITNPDIRVLDDIIGPDLAEPAARKLTDAKPDLVMSRDCKGLSTGSFAVRNTPFAYSLLLAVWNSKIRHSTPDADRSVLQEFLDGKSHFLPAGKIRWVPQRSINSYISDACAAAGSSSAGAGGGALPASPQAPPEARRMFIHDAGAGGGGRGVWSPGDFVLHISGCWKRAADWLRNCMEEFEWAWKQREQGWAASSASAAAAAAAMAVAPNLKASPRIRAEKD